MLSGEGSKTQKRSPGLPLAAGWIFQVIPAVDALLDGWWLRAEKATDTVLKMQALSGIEKKRSHCLAAGVFALWPGVDFSSALRFATAYQTICDYLENLCGHAAVLEEEAFRQLHLALTDAVDPEGELHDYYALFPQKNDGGYLAALVEECRAQARATASFPAVRGRALELAGWRREMQALRYGAPAAREGKLLRWAAPLAQQTPGLSPWELCAAAGSPLGVFALFAAASRPGLTALDADALLVAYFPWICALQRLLASLEDAGEDRRTGEINLTKFYRDEADCAESIAFFAAQALERIRGLPHAGFHRAVVRGLLALHLSDPRTESLGGAARWKLLGSGGPVTYAWYETCLALRKLKKL